ncbi:talin-1-like [Mercenaria mercenaria]|uniref:talin-1-like n=1 Tax=Mercenaria mercenaria TaxID=6596 RepID=UPI00234ED6EF|nr:talin-1-like [Mercenaria mercenaria]
MATLSLKISIVGNNTVKTMQFEPSMLVFDVCRIIRDRLLEAGIPHPPGNPNDFGLFLADEDVKKGLWLEAGRSLDYYLLRNADLLEYKSKVRILKVRTLDGTVRKMQIDDSHTVGQLLINITSKIGITNHEEYSLIVELPDDEKEKTLTLKRDKSIAKDQKKLEEMRKKLHTEDDMNWLDHAKTLREQGINTDEETLLLRRKFFFSDQNVDARDPVQLNLLFVQTRDAILNGTHPVSQEEAIMFAGIQCQIQFGDHDEQKHKPGLFENKEFLPKEYCKVKGIEKKIFQEHRKWAGYSERDAKVKYTQQCRALKTYGITFFLVKEKVKGKNKLVPRLLGINKESVVRVDEKTKEIMKTWPLTTVRRWAASPNSFTLDFGDHADQYYSVQTQEGEPIAALIAGYIDIILRKKKAKDHLGIEGDDDALMYEENVSSAKATIISHQSHNVSHPQTGSVSIPGVMRDGGGGESQISMGSMQQAMFSMQSNQAHAGQAIRQSQTFQEHGLTQAQRALVLTIDDGLSAVNQAQTELDQKIDLPDLGSDATSRKWKENNLDLSRQKVSAQLSAMNAATAQLVTLTGNDEPDYGAVGASVNQISSNLGDFTHDIRMLAALQEEDNSGEKLMDAARRLAGGLSDLLNSVQPERREPRQNVLNAASRVGEASHDVMDGVGETATDMDKAYQDALIGLAKAVANATAQLVLKAKTVASTTEDQEMQNRVISSATSCALATSQLVACTKVVAPTISSQACQEQLIESAKMVAHSVEGVVDQAAAVSQDEKLLRDLGEAATAVTQALNDLLKHIKLGAGPARASESQEEAVDTILTVTDRLFSSVGDAHEMVKQARQLAQATSMLVNTIRGQAESHPDSDVQKRLLAAAKALADATAKMVEAAKGCASSPNDSERQQQLRTAAEELRSATNTAASNALKKKLVQRLESAAKNAATASTQLINAAGSANKTNTNKTSQHDLEVQCKTVNEELSTLVQGFRGVANNRDSARAQLTLLKAAQEFVQPANSLVNAANAAAPTVTDQAAATNLHWSVKSMSAALAELRTASSKAQEVLGFMELESALEEVQELDKELIEMKQSANDGTLRPLPGETAETCGASLGANSKKVGSAMAQLLTAAAQGNDNYVGIAARDTANALRVFVNAARGVAANSKDKQEQQLILDSAREVIAKSNHLLEAARDVIDNPNKPDNQQRLQQVAKAVSYSLDTCVNCLPGQRDVDIAIRQITETSQSLSSQRFPSTNRSFTDVQGDMTDLPLFSGLAKDGDTQNQIVGGLKSVSMVSSKLLLAAKSVSIDPNAPNAKNLLAQAARAVTESINQLINICTVSAPGQKECDNALRQIEMMKSWLDNPNEPVSDMPYFECLDTVIEKSKYLGGAMTGMTNHAKKGEMDDFCSSVQSFSSSVCGLTEASVQAAYLVGIADPASEPGRPGLVDQSQFSRANQAIQMACQNLTNPASSQQQVLSAATVVAKHTSALCNACRLASSKTDNPVAKRHFVQSAKDVANSTANLVKAIKALDSNFTEENRQKCAEAAKPLVDAVDELTTFASSPEFASKQAKISPKARQAQEPITSAGKSLIDGACKMLEAAKRLAINPKDPPTYQLYSNHSKSVSDSIKRLVSAIRDSAPGQKECDEAIENVNKSIRDLDQASLAAISGNLPSRTERSLRSYQEQMISCSREILETIENVKKAASREPEKLGHEVTKMANYLEPLSEAAVGAASLMNNSKQQMSTLDLTKTVIESTLQFLYSSKEGGGNPKASTTQENITTAGDDMKDVVQDLLQMLEESVSQAGEVTTMIDKISKSITKTDERIELKQGLGFVDYQTNMVKLAKNIAKTSQDMVGKSGTDVENLGLLANQLTRDFDLLASDSRGAAASAQNAEIASRIRVNVQDLGKSCIELVQDAGNLQANPSDSYARQDITQHARSVTEKVSFILATLQSGSRGTQACINAAHTVSGIIADLDTTIMFATAGTLNADGDENFADHRENILKTAKALVEDTKTLVAGAASNQEQLANAAQMAVKTITRLADVVKFGAGSLGSEQQEAQVLLINAVKDVASALSDLISATKNASGKNVQDPAMLHLKESAKVMVTNVTSLLKTVKSVEDEATRGTRALESTIEAIGQEIKTYESTAQAYEGNPGTDKKASAEDLIRYTKPITQATAKAVAAGNSGRQEEVIVVANMGRKAVFDLLGVSKAAAASAETHDIRSKTILAGSTCAGAYKQLLEQVNVVLQKPSVEARQQLTVLSRQVATAVSEIVHAAEAIKGTDWVDPEDPTVIAENELLTAASSIEAAAKKLSQLQPRQKAKAADMSLSFDEQILEAAKSIAAATAALVKSASAAQRELVAQGKSGYARRKPFGAPDPSKMTAVGATYHRTDTDDDGQWSQGLISAAKMVAAATHSMCEAANTMVQGNASEEKLIASAKEVAASTAALLVACRVKADPGSKAMQRLQSAGNAVKRATEALVASAHQAKAYQEEEESVTINQRMVGGIAQVLAAQEEIIRKEKELQKARQQLATIYQHQNRFKERTADDDSSSSF